MKVNKKKIRKEIENSLSEMSEDELFALPEYQELLSGTISSLLKDTRYRDIELRLFDDKNGTAFTDGVSVNVAYNGCLVKGEKWDKYLAHLGMICHECGHILYTDFKNMDELERELYHLALSKQAEEIKKNASDLYQKIYLKKIHDIFNILEDMYIEECLAKEYDGLVIAGIDQVNKEHSKLARPYEEMEKFLQDNGCQLDVFSSLLLSYCRGFKHPGKMGPLTSKISSYLSKIKDKVDALRSPMAWSKKKQLLTEIADAVYEMMPKLTITDKKNDSNSENQASSLLPNKQEIEVNLDKSSKSKNSDDQDGDSKSENAKGDGQGNDESSSSESSSSSNAGDSSSSSKNDNSNSSSDESKKKSGDEVSEENTGNNSSKGKTGNSSSKGNAGNDSSKENAGNKSSKEDADNDSSEENIKRSEDVIANLPTGIRNIPRKPEEKEKERKITEEDSEKELQKALKEMAEEILENKENEEAKKNLEKCIDPNDLCVDLSIRNTNKYDQNIDVSNQYFDHTAAISKKTARKIENVLKHREEGGFEDGNMLGNKFNSKDVFKNDGKYFSKWSSGDEVPDVVFGLLIDQSGSMMGRRLNMALNAAYCLYQTCQELEVPVCINGHRMVGWENSCNVVRYVTFEKDNIHSLANARASGGTCDAGGLIVTAEELVKRPEKEKILIVISDGEPNIHATNNYFSYKGIIGDPGLEEFQSEVNAIAKYYRKQGIKIYGMALDDYINIKKIYGNQNTIDCSNIENLPNQMAKIIKKHVIKN